MKKRILAATMVVALLSAGAAFAGTHRGRGPEGCIGPGAGIQNSIRRAPDTSWLDTAPQAVKDAVKQTEVKRSEMRLEIAKGNLDAAKLRTLHNDMLKARRTVADYRFDQALKNPATAKNFAGFRGRGDGHGFGGGRMGGGMFSQIQIELSKDKPDMAKVKQLYTDVMNLNDKQAKERFELCLKYPGNFSSGPRGRF